MKKKNTKFSGKNLKKWNVDIIDDEWLEYYYRKGNFHKIIRSTDLYLQKNSTAELTHQIDMHFYQ